jgi:hypothetical protein
MSKNAQGGRNYYFDNKRQQWHGQIRLPTGKRKSVYGAKERDVIRKLNELRREIDAGLHDSLDGTKSLRVFADDWLTNRKASLRPRTYNEYARMVRNKLVGHHLKDEG